MGTNKLKKYEERLALFNLQLHQHAIFIENISGDGVYAAVKIFNYVYPIKLSSNTELFAREDFILVNEILTKSIFTNHTLYYQTETFSVDFANLNIDAQEKIKKSGDSYFEQINSSLIFYKADGKVRYENVTSLCSQIVKRERLFEKNIGEKFTLDLSERNLHIKTTDNSFVKVLSITVTSFIVIHHLPKLQQTPGK